MGARTWIRALALGGAAALGCAHGAPDGGDLRWPRKVEFEAPDGRIAFAFESRRDGIRLQDGGGKLLAVLRLEDESLTIEDARGHPVGVVVPPGEGSRGFRVLRPDQGTPLYEFRSEPDGDLKLIDANDELVYKLKRRDYGFKVVKRDGGVESRIRVGSDKISVRDASGDTFLSTRDRIPREAAVAITLDQLRFEYAAGLAVAVAHWSAAGK